MEDLTQDDVANPRLDDEQIAMLEEHGERMCFDDGTPLIATGERRGGFFVVIAGEVEIVDASGDTPRTIARHRPGEFTGDVGVVTRHRSYVSAIARGRTEVLHVSSPDIRRIISERPSIGDILLRAFIARREQLFESGYGGLRVIGSSHSRDAFALREFLARNHVPYTWLDVDSDEAIASVVERFGIGGDDLPAVMYASLPLMRRPSLRQVAEIIGLRRDVDGQTYDLVVIGAGPAGLAAAVYASSEGLSTLVLESVAPGGQAGASTRIENYLGFPTGVTGAELMGSATLQAQKFGAHFATPASVQALALDGEHPVVRLDSGESVTARTLLVATGADYRKLDVPERERFDSLGVYYAATKTELVACENRDVVVVGGGNSAGQALMFLAQHTRHVYLLLRGDDLRKSMSSYLAGRIEETPNIEILCHTQITSLFGETRLESVEVENTRSGERRRIETPAVFTFIGAVPRTGWLPGSICTDARGFISTGRAVIDAGRWSGEREPYMLETSHPAVFAAGDVRSGSIKRVSSAVGEGSMVVKFVHEVLADQVPADQPPAE